MSTVMENNGDTVSLSIESIGWIYPTHTCLGPLVMLVPYHPNLETPVSLSVTLQTAFSVIFKRR